MNSKIRISVQTMTRNTNQNTYVNITLEGAREPFWSSKNATDKQTCTLVLTPDISLERDILKFSLMETGTFFDRFLGLTEIPLSVVQAQFNFEGRFTLRSTTSVSGSLFIQLHYSLPQIAFAFSLNLNPSSPQRLPVLYSNVLLHRGSLLSTAPPLDSPPHTCWPSDPIYIWQIIITYSRAEHFIIYVHYKKLSNICKPSNL